MCDKSVSEWKFTRNNYNIVWSGPAETCYYNPIIEDEEEGEGFPFIGKVVNQHFVCACWDTEDSKNMGMVPSMIHVHVTICRQLLTNITARELMKDETFGIPIDTILRNHLTAFGDMAGRTVTSPRYIESIIVKIGIPNDGIPTIKAKYFDKDGDGWDFEELAIEEIRKDEACRTGNYLVDLAGEIDAIRKIQEIIPKMDSYWKDYVQEVYPDAYDPFEKKLLETMSHIKGTAVVAIDAAKPKTSREKLKSIYNVDILNMVTGGMKLHDKEIDKLTDEECDIVAESLK